MTIIDVIKKYARITPDDPAIVELKPVSNKRKEVSWSQFDERIDRLANSLIQSGVRKGDKVFLLGKNSLNWMEIYFAIIKTGAWVTPINFRFTDDEIRFCVNTAEPVAFFFDEDFTERIIKLMPEFPSIKTYSSIGGESRDDVKSMEDLIEHGSSAPVNVEIKDEDECALYFTSGTTGTPKAVLIQHKSIMCTAFTEATNHELVKSDRFLMMPPMYHVAIGHMLGLMLVGGCSILLTEQIKPNFIVDAIEKEHISVVFLLVPWAIDILEAFDKKEINIKDRDLSSWRLTHMGAQPIPPVVVNRLKDYFPAMAFDINYGLSESMGPGVVHLGLGNEKKVGAIGIPGLVWDIRIVNENGEDVKKGEIGELVVKGAGVMKEYYKNPELTSATIRNGWLYTGDLCREDDDGFIFLVDRKKDVIISGGENIYPGEVEDIIIKHPGVRDVALIGVPHHRMVEVAAAIVEPVAGEILSEKEVIIYCEEHLPRYKRPYQIFFDKVPRNSTGKLDKKMLREKYSRAN